MAILALARLDRDFHAPVLGSPGRIVTAVRKVVGATGLARSRPGTDIGFVTCWASSQALTEAARLFADVQLTRSLTSPGYATNRTDIAASCFSSHAARRAHRRY